MSPATAQFLPTDGDWAVGNREQAPCHRAPLGWFCRRHFLLQVPLPFISHSAKLCPILNQVPKETEVVSLAQAH